jgi:hypothetical protein
MEMPSTLTNASSRSSRPVILTVLFLGLLLGAFALLDYVVGISLLWPWMLGGLGLGLGLGLLGTIGLRSGPRLWLLLTFAVAFAGCAG